MAVVGSEPRYSVDSIWEYYLWWHKSIYWVYLYCLLFSDIIIPGGRKQGDPLLALMYAAKYPFRTGVSKTVIIIPCDECETGQVRYLKYKKLKWWFTPCTCFTGSI